MYRPFCAPVMSANRAWRTVAGLPPSTRRTAAHVYILRVAIACAPVALLNFNLPALKAAVLQLGSNLDKGLIVHANSSFYLHSDIFPRILPEFSQAVGVRVFTVVGRVESHSSTFVLDLGPLVFTALLLIACTAVCFRWRPTSRDTAPLRKKKGRRPERASRRWGSRSRWKFWMRSRPSRSPSTTWATSGGTCVPVHTSRPPVRCRIPLRPARDGDSYRCTQSQGSGVWWSHLRAPCTSVHLVYIRRPRQLRRCTALGRAAWSQMYSLR